MPLDLVRKYINQEIINPGSTDEESLYDLNELDIQILIKEAEDLKKKINFFLRHYTIVTSVYIIIT